MNEKIKVKIGIREGEYGPAARFEFPSNEHIFRILEAIMTMKGQDKYHFYFFNNVLVLRRYSEDVKEFLKEGAKRADYDIEFVEK